MSFKDQQPLEAFRFKTKQRTQMAEQFHNFLGLLQNILTIPYCYEPDMPKKAGEKM